MASGTNRIIIIVLTFISSIVMMIGCYTLAFFAYEQMFNVSSHRTVGMIFVSFFFLIIAIPTLLLTLFSPAKINLTAFALAIAFLFYEWFSVHPLRVSLMAGCFIISYIFVLIIKYYFLPSRTNTGF